MKHYVNSSYYGYTGRLTAACGTEVFKENATENPREKGLCKNCQRTVQVKSAKKAADKTLGKMAAEQKEEKEPKLDLPLAVDLLVRERESLHRELASIDNKIKAIEDILND